MQYVENQPEQEFLDDCKDYWDDAYDEIIQEIKELANEGIRTNRSTIILMVMTILHSIF